MWSDGARRVLAEGGARKPSVHPELAAWLLVQASLDGSEGPIVGACPACGQPLVADGEAAAVPWTVQLPDGSSVTVDGGGHFDGTTREQADARIRDAYPTGFQLAHVRPGLALFQGSLLTLMLGPLIVWVLAVLAVVMFLTHFANPAPNLP